MRVLSRPNPSEPRPDAGASTGGGPQSPGLHLMAELRGCRGGAALMTDPDALQAYCETAVAAAGLSAVGSLFRGFGHGKGVTGAVVLAESHLAVHTWPEHAYVTLDVYVCGYSGDNSAKAERLFEALIQVFGPTEPARHRLVRG